MSLRSAIGMLLIGASGAQAEELSRSAKVSDAGWLTRARSYLEAESYRPNKQRATNEAENRSDSAWILTNHAQRLQASVSVGGWELSPLGGAPRTKSRTVPEWRWRYHLTQVTRGDAYTRLTTPTVSDESNEVYLAYSPGIREWYKNSSAGIEQGFDLQERPHAGVGGELVLLGEVETDLNLKSASPDRLRFSRGSEEVFHYAGLKVVDASGRTLPSRLSYSTVGAVSRLSIHVDDSQAVYPVVVDPLATSPAWTVESDQASAFLGLSVSGAGDVNGDGFTDVILGAYLYDNGQSNEGRVYAYYGSVTGLATTPSWTVESNLASAGFGEVVASAGDVDGDGFSDVILGAEDFNNGQASEGRAFVYLGSSTGLETTPRWTAESNQANAFFSTSVAGAGDVNGDGYADVIVGADFYDNGQTNEGQAYVYLGSLNGPVTTPAWVVESDQANGELGKSVSSAGDVNGDGFADVLVGVPRFANGETGEGRALVFHGSSSGLSTTPAWAVESNQAEARFGRRVASAGDVNGDGYSDVLVAATSYSNGESAEGRVYLFLGSTSGLATIPRVVWEGNEAGAEFGWGVASAGDINRDGYDDVVLGARAASNGESGEGRAFMFLGSASGPTTNPDWAAEGDQAVAAFGTSLSGAGDTNGDGYADVLVGAPFFGNGETAEGRAYLYLGSGVTGDANGDQIPDVAFRGTGQVAEVVVGINGTPLALRFGGAALAAGIGEAPGSVATSLITVLQSGASYEWVSTSAITQKGRTFATTEGTGTPVMGCYVSGTYLAAAFIKSGKTGKLRLYTGSASSDVTMPRGILAVTCGAPVEGTSSVLALAKNPKTKKLYVESKNGTQKVFKSRPLPARVAQAGIRLGFVPRGAGVQPTAMVLARQGRSKVLFIRAATNTWKRLAVAGVPKGSTITDLVSVRIGTTTYVVVQLTTSLGVISYKSLVVPANYL